MRRSLHLPYKSDSEADWEREQGELRVAVAWRVPSVQVHRYDGELVMFGRLPEVTGSKHVDALG